VREGFEAVKELFWVGRGVRLQMQREDIHPQDQEDCRCQRLATIPAHVTRNVKGRLQCFKHFTLMEGPRHE